MSGGKWQYLASTIGYMVEDLDAYIAREERKSKADQWMPETMQRLRDGSQALQRAAIYERRIDWLLSGDDGEESFHRRLAADLAKLEAETLTRGVPASILTAIMRAIDHGGGVVVTQRHLDALLKAVGDILAYNDGGAE